MAGPQKDYCTSNWEIVSVLIITFFYIFYIFLILYSPRLTDGAGYPLSGKNP